MKNKLIEYQCPYCDKIIVSAYQKQAEYNYKLHHDSCKKREAMEVKRK